MQLWIHEDMLLMSARVFLCLLVSISPVPSLALTSAAHVLKDKTTGTEPNQWLEQRWVDGASDNKMSAVSLSGSSFTLNPAT